MKGLYAVATVVCASSLICTLVSNFVTNGSTKKILNFVLGAFIICSLIVPLKNAVSSINTEISYKEDYSEITSTYDEIYNKQLVAQTRENLEGTLKQILEQNGIIANGCEIILSLKDDNSIIISSVSIYIDKEYTPYADKICELTSQNFGITPNIITE